MNVECNNKMVHNEEELIAGSLKIGASERICTVLCQGANMLASGVGPFTIISLLISAPGLRCALNKETNKSCLAGLASLTKRTKQGRSNSQLKSKKKTLKNADSKKQTPKADQNA